MRTGYSQIFYRPKDWGLEKGTVSSYTTGPTKSEHIFQVPEKCGWMVCKHARRQRGTGKTQRANVWYSSIG